MSQNIYDDGDFFAAYSGLRRSIDGLDGAPEWPALCSLLPDLDGCNVLDLGSGFGWFCRWAATHGAGRVVGLELSTRMLAAARELDDDTARIEYRRVDLATEPWSASFGAASFDLVFSSLTLHYLADIARVIADVAHVLRPGGRLVFSVEHPIATAPLHPAPALVDGRSVWPLDSYLDEAWRTTDWLADGVRKYHRTVATYLAALRSAGLRLDDLIEWGPPAEQLAEHPEWEADRVRPAFLLVAAVTD